jgi:hypothetical protein
MYKERIHMLTNSTLYTYFEFSKQQQIAFVYRGGAGDCCAMLYDYKLFGCQTLAFCSRSQQPRGLVQWLVGEAECAAVDPHTLLGFHLL